MLKELWIILNYNLYESKRHFSQKLAEAFERRGVNVTFIDAQKDPPSANFAKNRKPPDLCCSFHRTAPTGQGNFFWDEKQLPFWSILVDSAFYDLNLINSPLSLISCVDECDLDLLKSNKFERAFFSAHGVERDLEASPKGERPYDVVFIGSCYDPDGLRKAWKQYTPPQVSNLILDAAHVFLNSPKMPFWIIVEQLARERKLHFNPPQFAKIGQLVDYYARGIDRLNLIRSIKDARVHVFGGTCWRDEQPVLGWNTYLSNQANVVLHPAVSYTQSLEILKQSKICLNSVPSFKKGGHERILNGLMCGSAVITTENLWTPQNFTAGEEISMYPAGVYTGLNDQVNELLADKKKRQGQVAAGRVKVLQHHTWDHRVQEMLNHLELQPLRGFPSKKDMSR